MRAIYAIKCVDGRHYVGSTTRTKVRWSKHRSLLRLGRHSNTPLQTAWTQLGEAAFSFVILELVPEGDLIQREQVWLDQMEPQGALFNIAKRAGSNAGLIHTPETRAVMAERKRGRFVSAETRARLSESKRGANSPVAKVTASDVIEIRRQAGGGLSQRQIAKTFGISQTSVSSIVRREKWTHVP
jgi:group I intron endonuclease